MPNNIGVFNHVKKSGDKMSGDLSFSLGKGINDLYEDIPLIKKRILGIMKLTNPLILTATPTIIPFNIIVVENLVNCVGATSRIFVPDQWSNTIHIGGLFNFAGQSLVEEILITIRRNGIPKKNVTVNNVDAGANDFHISYEDILAVDGSYYDILISQTPGSDWNILDSVYPYTCFYLYSLF